MHRQVCYFEIVKVYDPDYDLNNQKKPNSESEEMVFVTGKI
jgi:hypothetical protein